MNPVYSYINYRDYLRDYFCSKKESNPNFSHRVFARLAGFKTSNFIYLVMTGKRNITEKSSEKIARAMKMRKREREYFKLLVQFDQAASIREKKRLSDALGRLRKGTSYRHINRDMIEYISNWVHPVVRELICMVHNPEDYASIAAKLFFHVTPGTIKKSVQLLLRLGLLVRNADGTFSQAQSLLSTGPGTTEVAATHYHLGAMNAAVGALSELPPEKREMVGMTLGINRNTFEVVRQKLWEMRQEILALAEEPFPEEIYQMNIQFFKVTR